MKRRSLFASLLSLIPIPLFKKKEADYLAVGWLEFISKENTFDRVAPCEIPEEWRWIDVDDLRAMMEARYHQRGNSG